MNVKKEELEELVCYAMRYAIGRQSYSVSDVCGFFLSRLSEWSDHCLIQAIKDIDSAGHLGNQSIDEPMWLNVREKCYSLLLTRHTEEKLLSYGISKEYTGQNLWRNLK